MEWKKEMLELLKKLMLTFIIICKNINCLRSSCCDTTIIMSPPQSPNNSPVINRRHSI